MSCRTRIKSTLRLNFQAALALQQYFATIFSKVPVKSVRIFLKFQKTKYSFNSCKIRSRKIFEKFCKSNRLNHNFNRFNRDFGRLDIFYFLIKPDIQRPYQLEHPTQAKKVKKTHSIRLKRRFKVKTGKLVKSFQRRLWSSEKFENRLKMFVLAISTNPESFMLFG